MTYKSGMNLFGRLSIQASVFGIAGGVVGYCLGPRLPSQTVAELIQALGNISAIAGSILGWSVGWLSQSRSLVKEIDYDAARHLFRELGDLQRELIWRWGLVFSSSILVIICAVVMKIPNLNADAFRWIMTGATALLGVALGYVLYLFQRMLALSELKSKLDNFEQAELRKKRLLDK
jgi:hypothetical protein